MESSGRGGANMSRMWTPERVESYRQASEYTSFHKKLGVLTHPYLDERWTLADIGCGPGLIDPHIAPVVKHITAIDSDPVAIAALEDDLNRMYATNRMVAERIAPVLMDANGLADEMFDAALLSFVGADAALLRTVLAHVRRRLIIFDRRATHLPVPDTMMDTRMSGNMGSPELEAFLGQEGCNYKKTSMEMQFGQPFKSIADIHDFLSRVEGAMPEGQAHAGGEDAAKRVADVEERIIKTNRFDYPYYLPKAVNVTMFVVAAQGQAAGG